MKCPLINCKPTEDVQKGHYIFFNLKYFIKMKFNQFLVIGLFSTLSWAGVQQEKLIKHTVEKSETVYSIARKYKVTPFDIYRLNPDAKEGIKVNATLVIPSKNGQEKEKVKTETKETASKSVHVVQPKETLFSLARQYGVSVADLNEWNPEVAKNGLKIGDQLIVSKNYKPTASNDKVDVSETKTTHTVSTHVVKTQETVYGIAKNYNISIAELTELNPQIKEGLKIGDTLKIKKTEEVTVSQIKNVTKFYTVQPKETLYSLTKQFNITENQLLALNPELREGLKEGMQIKLPEFAVQRDTLFDVKSKVDLLKTIDYKTAKELVLLLPIDLPKIESDSSKTVNEIIKSKEGRFLNMTLDFYSGAMMAIDSAKVLGLPVKVKVLDVENSKSSSNLMRILRQEDFSQVNAVIGPFRNSHVETTAEFLAENNIPVISPLSKELSKPLPNLYNAVPSKEEMSGALFDYMLKQQGNIIAVVSSKKASTLEMLKANYSFLKYPTLNEKGGIDLESIKNQLVKGRKNFVLIDSERAGQILSISSFLMKQRNEYDIQLAALELYDVLDFEEIPMRNLTELQLLFPSINKEITSFEDKKQLEKLRKINKGIPNKATLKGFDVTFDTLLRICQPEGFVASAATASTEGLENGFNYVAKNGVNINNKIYLNYYDTDYTIKQVQ